MQLTSQPSDLGGMFLLLQTRYLGNRDESPLSDDPDSKEIGCPESPVELGSFSSGCLHETESSC